MSSHQEREYAELQTAIPCSGRGELEIKYRNNSESGCCKDKQIVDGVKFYCTILNKDIYNTNMCWLCNKRR